jgi:hypothetical protein
MKFYQSYISKSCLILTPYIIAMAVYLWTSVCALGVAMAVYLWPSVCALGVAMTVYLWLNVCALRGFPAWQYVSDLDLGPYGEA